MSEQEKPVRFKQNPLGDLRAEADKEMLRAAFIETPDLRTLIDSPEKTLLVGRRGAGKSALSWKLNDHWSKEKCSNFLLRPTESEMLGLRFLSEAYGGKFSYTRASCRIAWKYAILSMIADSCIDNYRVQGTEEEKKLRPFVTDWRRNDGSLFGRLRRKTRSILGESSGSPGQIADMHDVLQLKRLEELVLAVLRKARTTSRVIFDGLDEGYEPDDSATGIIAGLVQASVDINTHQDSVIVVVCVRDNIFRTLVRDDPDFTRNVESRVLRIHWDEQELFNMACSRIKRAFSIAQEQSQRVWSGVTAEELRGRSGFRRCLKYTLYRPRDVIALLNEAFNAAARRKTLRIRQEDVQRAARHISSYRLEDLVKEYESVFPGLGVLVRAFSGGPAERTLTNSVGIVQEVLQDTELPAALRRAFAVFDDPIEILAELYAVGFLGVYDRATDKFVFRHDGRKADVRMDEESRLLVHPCYCMALNIDDVDRSNERLEEIYDDYDIAVVSQDRALRNRKLGHHLAELDKIPLGQDGASRFERWCHESIRFLYAGGLQNIQLKPNLNRTQRRDVVATNYGETRAWKRILEDYKGRQVVFEVKNIERDLGPDEYRQMISYLGKDYGRIGFIISRNPNAELQSGRELDWAREAFAHEGRFVVVKLTAKFLSRGISKLRSPQKHNDPDTTLCALLDTYTRLYLGGSGAASGGGGRSRKRRGSRSGKKRG